MEEKKPFWTTLPGVLTGAAAVITALTASYVAVYNSHKKLNQEIAPSASAASEPSDVTEASDPSDWPIIIDETFTGELSGWSIGSFPTEGTPRFDLRLVDGKYRWDLKYSREWYRGIVCPIGSAVNFYFAVDVKVIESDPETTVNLIFNSTGTANKAEEYVFAISANKYFGLLKTHPDGYRELIINWTPIAFDFDPKSWNRMSVTVDNQLIKLFLNSNLLGEFRDTNLTGGKFGLDVWMFKEGVAVVDFDNLQLRKKP